MSLAPGTVAAIRRRYRSGFSIAVIARELQVSYESACWALSKSDVRHEIVFENPFHTRLHEQQRPKVRAQP